MNRLERTRDGMVGPISALSDSIRCKCHFSGKCTPCRLRAIKSDIAIMLNSLQFAFEELDNAGCALYGYNDNSSDGERAMKARDALDKTLTRLETEWSGKP